MIRALAVASALCVLAGSARAETTATPAPPARTSTPAPPPARAATTSTPPPAAGAPTATPAATAAPTATPAATAAPTATPAATAAPASEPVPDEITDTEAREANLESNAPRRGVTTAVAFVGGIMLGDDVGRGPGASFRIGHVATRKTVITFELAVTGALHRGAGVNDPTLTDSGAGLLLGAQRYTSPSVWVRIGGGLDVLTKDIGASGTGSSTHTGVAGILGGGLDLARWGYLVLGLETFAMASVTGDGFKVQLGFGVGLSYY